jgi:hypothetical protein
MLFFLTKKWPLFAATSDMYALLEQALILGREAMVHTAALHGMSISIKLFVPFYSHPCYR